MVVSPTMAVSSAPRYLLDTNILVAYIRAGALGEWIEEKYRLGAAVTVPLVCAVSEGELHSLAMRNKWGEPKMRQLDTLLKRFVLIQLDFPNIIATYAQIDNYSLSAARNMGKNDLWIAAAAAVTGARLLTTDKDFDHLPSAFLSHDYIDPKDPATKSIYTP